MQKRIICSLFRKGKLEYYSVYITVLEHDHKCLFFSAAIVLLKAQMILLYILNVIINLSLGFSYHKNENSTTLCFLIVRILWMIWTAMHIHVCLFDKFVQDMYYTTHKTIPKWHFVFCCLFSELIYLIRRYLIETNKEIKSVIL
jgi:hypothetical protein